MCGIFGIVTNKEQELGPTLIEAAQRLTYRGYDSVGAATLSNGKIDLPKLKRLVRALADGSLKHEDVFNDMGHGALVYDKTPLEFGKDNYDIVVTGPRRSLFASAQRSEIENKRSLRPHFAVPFGDMMIAGCFGLLAAAAEVLPELAEPIQASLQAAGGQGVAPWDA